MLVKQKIISVKEESKEWFEEVAFVEKQIQEHEEKLAELYEQLNFLKMEARGDF